MSKVISIRTGKEITSNNELAVVDKNFVLNQIRQLEMFAYMSGLEVHAEILSKAGDRIAAMNISQDIVKAKTENELLENIRILTAPFQPSN